MSRLDFQGLLVMVSAIETSPSTTIVCPHLDVAHRPGVSLVWSAGLTLGWKELIQRAGGPIEVVGADEPAAALVRAMNEAAAQIERPSSAGVTFWLGGERGRATIVEEESPPDAHSRGPRLSVAGSLAMHPRFAAPFARSGWGMRAHRQWVECFGLWYDEDEPVDAWERRARQVIVHFPRWTDEELGDLSEEDDDAAWNELVAELTPADGETRIVLANVGRAATLRGTVERALSYLQDDNGAHPMGRFTRQELLYVPVFDFRSDYALLDLAGLAIGNAALRGLRLGELRQAIRFRLDEGGAGPVSIPQNPFAPALTCPRRWYNGYWRPLLLVLDRMTRTPVFAAWVEDASMFIEEPEPALMRQARSSS